MELGGSVWSTHTQEHCSRKKRQIREWQSFFWRVDRRNWLLAGVEKEIPGHLIYFLFFMFDSCSTRDLRVFVAAKQWRGRFKCLVAAHWSTRTLHELWDFEKRKKNIKNAYAFVLWDDKVAFQKRRFHLILFMWFLLFGCYWGVWLTRFLALLEFSRSSVFGSFKF